MKKVLTAVVGLALSLVLVACGTSQNSSKSSSTADSELVDKGTLTIGLEGTFQPYSYHDNGKLTGFEVELGRDIAKKLNLKPKFVETKWDSLIAGLDVDKYDLVLNNVAITPERQAKYAFTSTYIAGKTELAVSKDNKSIKTLKDVKGKKLAQSVTSNNAADAKRLGADIVPVDGFAQAVALIDQGRADGTLNDTASFYAYLKQQPNANIRLISAGNNIKAQPIAGIMTKKDTKLKAKINSAIKSLKADGTLKKLSVRFFGADVTEK
ncbi:transporter substrate-binding domain-containing protein [Lacticaseibacillus saniviri]